MYTRTLTSVRDAGLLEGNPDTNNGTITAVAVGSVTAGTVLAALVSFDMTGVDVTNLHSATLRLFCTTINGAGSGDQFVHRVRRTNWVENQVTWNIYKTGSNWTTAGALSTASDIYTGPVSTTPPTEIAWHEIDVTTLVALSADNLVTFRIGPQAAQSGATNTHGYRARESITPAGHPQLVVVENSRTLDARQIYDRPKTIVGQKIRGIKAKLHTYNVEATAKNIFDGDIILGSTETQEVTIQHQACEVGALPTPLVVNSGGTLAVSPAPVYRTYSTTFTVNPTATTMNVTLEGYAVEITSRSFEKTYDTQGEILEFECPVATDPALVEAMIDHYQATASATSYEVAVRDNPSQQVGDLILLERPVGRWGTTVEIIPTVLTQVKRSYTGAQDAVYTLVTDVTT